MILLFVHFFLAENKYVLLTWLRLILQNIHSMNHKKTVSLVKGTAFLILFLFVTNLNAQVYQWAQSVGSSSTGVEEGNSIAADASGNVFVTGEFRGTADFDPSLSATTLTLIGSSDAFIAKYNSAGTLQWAYNFGSAGVNSRGVSLTTDANGNVYLTGIFRGTIDIDPGPSVTSLTSASGSTYDIFLAKFSSAGLLQWGFNIGAGADDTAGDVMIDNTGNVMLCGFYQNSMDVDPGLAVTTLTNAGSYDSFVAKYNSNTGNLMDSWKWGGAGSDRCFSMTGDAANNILVTGRFTGTCDFDPSANVTSSVTNGAEDGYVVKFSNTGVYAWHIALGSAGGNEECLGVVTDASNDVYVTGSFLNTVDFDPSATTNTLTSAGGFDAYVAKYSSAGLYQWAFANGSTGVDNGTSIALLNNEVVALGNFNATVDFDPSSTATYTLLSGGGSDVFIGKYSTAGAFLSAINMGGSTADAGKSIATFSTNVTLITGSFNGVADFNPDPAATNTISSNGATDVFFAKYYTCTVGSPSVTVNNGTVCAGQSFTMIPNGALSYTYSNGNAVVSPTSNATYTVTGYDVYGCYNTAVSSVSVNPLPVITVVSSNSVLCNGQTATLTPGGAQSYTITGGVYIVTPTVTTTYTITGTGTNGCENSTAFTQTVSACTGLDAMTVNEKNNLTVFPNPSTGVFTLQFKAGAHISVLNVLGERIYTSNTTSEFHTIDLKDQANGIYFVQTVHDQTIQTVRLIKQ